MKSMSNRLPVGPGSRGGSWHLLSYRSTYFKRASTFAPGIGKNITELLDKDVVVTHASVSERNFDGELRPIVIVTLENGEIYHAWSASLADKISEIPDDAWPLTFKFVRLATRRPGQTVLSFE